MVAYAPTLRKGFYATRDKILIVYFLYTTMQYIIFVQQYSINGFTMGSKAMSFRFDEEIIELVKEKAKAQKRSLNNYIEMLMAKDVGNIPNEETKKAIEDARNGIGLEPMDNIDVFFGSIREELDQS